MIGIHLQDRWIKKKETGIDEITRDVRTLLKTAEICGAKFEEYSLAAAAAAEEEEGEE
jgi:hypothetical protein